MKTSIANEDRFPSAQNLFCSLLLMMFSLELLFPENYKVLFYNSRFSQWCPKKMLLWRWLCPSLVSGSNVLSHPICRGMWWLRHSALATCSIGTESCCPFIVTPRVPIFNFLVINTSSKWSCKPGHGIIILTLGATAAAVTSGHGLCWAPKPLPPTTETRDRH